MTCEGCDGSGWRRVQHKYAEHQANLKHPLPEAELTEQQQAVYDRQWASAYATALNSVYPCKVCNADTFWRWANGHLERTHDRASCAECITLGVSGSKRKHPGRSTRANDRPPPPAEPPEERPAYDDLEAAAT